MNNLTFKFNDGGRSKYFEAKNVGDCVTRAIANATGIDYLEIYKRLKDLAKYESTKNHRGHKQSSVRNGVFKETWKQYLDEIGMIHIKTSGIGLKEKMHLNADELPKKGTYIVQVSKHLTCVKDGILYDTYDCTRDGGRMVYGMWRLPSDEEKLVQTNINKITENKLKKKAIQKSIKEKYNKEIYRLKYQIKRSEAKREKELANAY